MAKQDNHAIKLLVHLESCNPQTAMLRSIRSPIQFGGRVLESICRPFSRLSRSTAPAFPQKRVSGPGFTIEGLGKVAVIDGNLLIFHNPSLSSLTGLNYLGSVTGNLEIDNNPAIEDLFGLTATNGPVPVSMFEVAESAKRAERKDATCAVNWRIRNSLAPRQTPVKMKTENSGGHVMAELTFTARFDNKVVGDADDSILEAIVLVHVGRAAVIGTNAEWCVLSVTEKLQ